MDAAICRLPAETCSETAACCSAALERVSDICIRVFPTAAWSVVGEI